MNDQGLNARLLEGKKVGVEIGRDERDGSFRSDSVAESIRRVLVDSDGEVFRARAREMRQVFASRVRMDRYIDDFVEYLNRFGTANGPESAAIVRQDMLNLSTPVLGSYPVISSSFTSCHCITHHLHSPLLVGAPPQSTVTSTGRELVRTNAQLHKSRAYSQSLALFSEATLASLLWK
ncbi:hypothetical protein Syun_003292 [Stephania yunnanensis]|uniref:Uncharacterized protein n=1 Tax=Stephania yunnanensis TaxID=152371 RepID=A0AAP0L3H7_9MAGN